MKGSIVFGLLTGLLTAVLLAPVLQPVGSILLWGLMALELSAGALVLWRRTRLPIATGSMIAGAATSLLLCVRAVGGHRFPLDGAPWLAAAVAGIVIALLGLFLESRLHTGDWNRWRRHARQASALDYLTFRHIPNLREPDDGG